MYDFKLSCKISTSDTYHSLLYYFYFQDAIRLFHELSDALEVLTDENTRRAYDNVLKARKANELRNRYVF